MTTKFSLSTYYRNSQGLWSGKWNIKESNLIFPIIFIIISLLSSGCSSPTPPMVLHHMPVVEPKYSYQGTLVVEKFTDDRPTSQKQLSQSPSVEHTFAGEILYSRVTNPDAVTYLQTVLSEEINQSGMFHSMPTGEYRLVGTLNSLKVNYKPEKINVPITLNGNSTPITLGGYPYYTAQVKYHVDLYKSGKKVFSKEIISNVKEIEYDSSIKNNPALISARAAQVLDQTIDKSVSQLLKSLASR